MKNVTSAVSILRADAKSRADCITRSLHTAQYATKRAVCYWTGMASCELCELARTTTWYAEHNEPFRFVIVDCDSCDVPMAVLGAHRSRVSAAEQTVIQAALAQIADGKYPGGWFFDDHMRQIPEHYHLHARPYPSWWPHR